MVERLDFGGAYYDDEDYDDELDIDLDHQEDDQGEYRDSDGEDAAAEDFQGRHDQVEHQLEHAADDTQTDFDEQFGWRSKARRSRQGLFVPPDMGMYRWPIFVPVADLQNQGETSAPST